MEERTDILKYTVKKNNQKNTLLGYYLHVPGQIVFKFAHYKIKFMNLVWPNL